MRGGGVGAGIWLALAAVLTVQHEWASRQLLQFHHKAAPEWKSFFFIHLSNQRQVQAEAAKLRPGAGQGRSQRAQEGRSG